MRKMTIILISAFAALVVFVVSFALRASRPPALHVGSTVNDPWAYISERVRDQADGEFRHVYCGMSSKDVIVYVTQFSFLRDHRIASRSFIYSFDTNCTVVSIKSKWKFQIFDF